MIDSRPKLRISPREYMPPREKPPRSCSLCGEIKEDWRFSTRLPVCWDCASKAYLFGRRGLTCYNGVNYQDGVVLNAAGAVVIAMEAVRGKR